MELAGAVPLGDGIPILGEQSEEEKAAERAMQELFAAMVDQDEDFMQAGAPFFGTDEAKQEILNQIAQSCLQFTIARIFRYRMTRGEPYALRLVFQVEVDGDESKVQDEPETT